MELYKFQKDVLDQTTEKNKVAYYLDMGLGKTFVGSEKMVQLGARVNLVICQKSKINDWIQHMSINYPKYYVADLSKKSEYEDFIGTWDVEEGYIVGVINYDLIWRRKELLKLHDFTLMLDESSLIQNETSKRSKFILKMQPANIILLSGTPTGGKYETLWSQLHLLGWNISKEMYYNHYVDYEWDNSQGLPLMKINGYKNETRLKKKMRDNGCIFLKTEEVHDLPDQIDQKIFVESSKEYKKFRSKSIVEFDDITLVGDTTLTKLLYERQLCGQYSVAKLKAFEDLLESTDDRIIVFYNFNAELDALKHISDAQNRDSSIVNGQIKDLYAYENKTDSVTYIQYQAGAMGLNLQKANKIVYFTLPLSSELFEQSKKRIHRIGQQQTCFYYYLLCKRSVEEHIFATLKLRKNYTDALFTLYT